MASATNGIDGRLCETPGCGHPAKLQCPTCIKLNLPQCHFCSQVGTSPFGSHGKSSLTNLTQLEVIFFAIRIKKKRQMRIAFNFYTERSKSGS